MIIWLRSGNGCFETAVTIWCLSHCVVNDCSWSVVWLVANNWVSRRPAWGSRDSEAYRWGTNCVLGFGRILLGVSQIGCQQGSLSARWRPVLSNVLTSSGEQSVKLNMLVTYQAHSFWVRFYGVKIECYMWVPCPSVRLWLNERPNRFYRSFMKFGIGGIWKSVVKEACIYGNRVLNTSALLNLLATEFYI